MSNLKYFFEPNSVAIIGASGRDGSVGNVLLRNFLSKKFKGRVYPVNPHYGEILGRKCYPSIIDIPDEIDMAVIATPAHIVPRVLKECAEKKVKSVVIISGGFSEIGEEGRRREEEVVKIAKESNIRIIGPNCVGVFDSKTGVDTVFLPRYKLNRPEAGPIAFISQSGAFASAMMDWCASVRLGISKMISLGNKCDVDEAELLEFLAEDEDTKVIVLYIEGFKENEGRKFIDAARKVVLRKPIIAIKSGRSRGGARAVSSHTGALAGVDQVYDAAFKQAGVIRAKNFEEAFDLAKALFMQPVARGPRVLIVTNGGGAGVMAVDACEELGLCVPELPPEIQRRLYTKYPPHCIVKNPVDVTGDTDALRYRIALEDVLPTEHVDTAMVIMLFTAPLLDLTVVDHIADIADSVGKPIVTVVMGGMFAMRAAELLEENNIPAYPTPERAAKALWALHEYHRRREEIRKILFGESGYALKKRGVKSNE
ncbi:MAG: acetate--CoA ligase family protein [Candidatus Baldrarchaeia archaeon]